MKKIKYKINREPFEGHDMSENDRSLLDNPGLLRWAKKTVANLGKPMDQSVKDVPEITNPRAILDAIRTAIDLMMHDGEGHKISNGVEIDLRGLLGECDALRPFVCKNRQPEEFDWHELKALRVEVVEQRRRLKTLVGLLRETKDDQ